MNGFIKTLLVYTVLVTGSAIAETNIVRSVVTETAYESEVAAATAAITEALNSEYGHQYEYGGCIVKAADGYHYTNPVTEKYTTAVNPHCFYHHGDVVVASYHTHVNNITKLDAETKHSLLIESVFSQEDIDEANHNNRKSYIGVDGDGHYEERPTTIRLFIPKVTKTKMDERGRIQIADGELIAVM